MYYLCIAGHKSTYIRLISKNKNLNNLIVYLLNIHAIYGKARHNIFGYSSSCPAQVLHFLPLLHPTEKNHIPPLPLPSFYFTSTHLFILPILICFVINWCAQLNLITRLIFFSCFCYHFFMLVALCYHYNDHLSWDPHIFFTDWTMEKTLMRKMILILILILIFKCVIKHFKHHDPLFAFFTFVFLLVLFLLLVQDSIID